LELLTSSSTTGNETNSVSSTLSTNAQVDYLLTTKKLYKEFQMLVAFKFQTESIVLVLMDDNQNGVDNALEPSNCNNSFSATFTDANNSWCKGFQLLQMQNWCFLLN
jgi:hypothetical protein